ncbi:endonuclease/exonuclease/phosphatase [Haloechinothrix sp. YIM 98757]|uniref:Endonuclease/exonuclease/phosphatase n=1 Tax=Haloechinothrix aidingensis TaxID=2752311 RepID=A0A838AED4_9PSEU|nr:endonuclease/exonuclease/phosphatase [Haloechinothrix aidingensis]
MSVRGRRLVLGGIAVAVLAGGAIAPASGSVARAGLLTACSTGDTGVDPGQARIGDIQGTTRLSPLDGERAEGVPGIVTARRSFGSKRGFWFQDPHGSDDPRASDGLFVFTGDTTPDVEPGDEVMVTGTVQEYYPRGADDGPYPSTTELIDAEWTVASSGNEVPEPELVEPGTVPEELAPEPGGNIEELELEPDTYALDFWESREGMLSAVRDVPVVGPTTEHDELYVTTKPEQYPSPRGGTVYTGYDNDNTGVLKIKQLIPFSERPFPEVDTGDTLAGVTAGPVSYDRFGGYTLQATELGEVRPGGLEREVAREHEAGELAVANYNVENLSGVDDQKRFDEIARSVVDNLATPDILTLEEVQDDTGAEGEGDGVVDADVTLGRLADAISDAGGPRYRWRQISPEEGEDGGQPGGNIRVAFLYDPERVTFVDRPGGDATTPVEVESSEGSPRLSVSPGRIDPQHQAWRDSRKPLVGEFDVDGRTVFVVGNHFNSKRADQPVHGRFQPPERVSEEQRVQQAELVRGFVDEVLDVAADANVLVAGDLNDYAFSPAVGALTSGVALDALIETLPENERYTTVFEGRSQALDHMLLTPAARGVDFEVIHINAEFREQSSDHDPTLVRFRPAGGD